MTKITAPSSAAAVANEFLDLQDADRGFPPIDQMKVQKLIFYAHAWHLALKGAALFDEDIEAWPWGPVVRNIYLEFRDFGASPIVGKKAREMQRVGPGATEFRFVLPSVTNAEAKEFIRNVWDIHKPYTGIQLSNATHAEGEPWTIVKSQYGSLDGKPTIPNQLIADVFTRKAKHAA